MPAQDRPTHDTVLEPQPGDGVEIGVDHATQARSSGPSSRRTFGILILSLLLAIVVLGVFWMFSAPSLNRADPNGHGQLATNPATTSQFQAPEPQPKQPPVDQIARSSGSGGGG